MKTKFLLLFAFFSGSLAAQIERPIGINLTGIRDWSTELVFTDAFKQSRYWTPFNADGSGPWDTGVEVALDENGYPLEIPYDDGINPPQTVRALMLWDIGEAVPQGQYRLIVQGSGQVRLVFGANGVFDCPVDTYVNVTGGVSLEIMESDPADPITSIQFIYPDYVNSYQEKAFTDEFLDFASDFQVIRFMDWLDTNFSPVTTWDERGKKSYFTQTLEHGVAWEYVAELCNLLQKDAWINIPHMADDDYIFQLATLLKDQLDPDLHIYLEYSNEVWNAQFSQHQYAGEKALELGYTGTPWERAWKYTAKRSADIFAIFEDVFGGDARLVKIIPSQAANSWLTNQIVTYFKDPFYNPQQISADAIAIAPYFGGSVANDIVDEGLVNAITIPEIVDRMEETLPQAFAWMVENQDVANTHSLRLLVYEGGQHLVGTGANVNIDALTEKLIQANHHPDLQEPYCQYLDHWFQENGDLFMHFSSHSTYSKWGSWGVKENMADVGNPKYLALQECVFAYNNPSGTAALPGAAAPRIWPNPAIGGVVFVEGEWSPGALQVADMLGRSVSAQVAQTAGGQTRISISGRGVFFLSFRTEVGQLTRKVFIPY
jgi:uncharacterized protein YneR